MKIFVDSANLLEIEEALERGFPSGITTNPSILAKEEKADFREHINKIIELVQRYGYDIPLSVEVFSTRPEEISICSTRVALIRSGSSVATRRSSATPPKASVSWPAPPGGIPLCVARRCADTGIASIMITTANRLRLAIM